MTIEDKLSNLPVFGSNALDATFKPIYAVRDGNVALKQGNAVNITGTYIGPSMLDVRTLTKMTEETNTPRVLAEVYSDADSPSKVAGYLIIDHNRQLQVVALPKLAEFLATLPRPLTNVVYDVAYRLGKQLKLTTQVHRLFTYFPDANDDQTKGYRNQDGTIKKLLPDRLSRHWFCSLTYKDLRTLYDYYNKLIFDNKLCQVVNFKWLENSSQPSYVEIAFEQESDALKAEFVEGYRVMRVTIYINREFFKEHPHLFLEIFIHDLIHCLGTPAMHNAAFSRYCEVASAKIPSLDILDVDIRDITEAKGKWSTLKSLQDIKADNHDSVAMFCPICDNLLKPGRGNSCVCIQGHTLKFK